MNVYFAEPTILNFPGHYFMRVTPAGPMQTGDFEMSCRFQTAKKSGTIMLASTFNIGSRGKREVTTTGSSPNRPFIHLYLAGGRVILVIQIGTHQMVGIAIELNVETIVKCLCDYSLRG